MKVVIAIDSFKGSLSSIKAGNAVKEAILKADENSEIFLSPLADGGEGTVEAFSSVLNSDIIETIVTGPLLEPVNARYCILKDTNTAVIEMAAASGLTLIPKNKRNPLETTTYGVGELIKDAINRGCRRFIVGIGGSATNDGGVGMLTALGYEFLDKDNSPISLGAKGLEKLSEISCKNVISQLKDCSFCIACDVTNPLCGEKGSSVVFGPQKGATEKMVEDMDIWLENYANIVKEMTNKDFSVFEGAGAAGGLGFAFLSFTNATLSSGIEIVLKEIKIEEHIKDADIVVTGEGRLDRQTVMGKAPMGVAKLAKKYGKKVIAFCGSASKDAELCNESGIDAFFSILREVTSLDDALDESTAYKNLKATAYQVFRLLLG